MATTQDPAASAADQEVRLQVVSRRKWKAQASTTRSRQWLTHPVTYVRLTDTTTEDTAYDDVSDYMREHQKFGMNFVDLTDIPYNFVVGSDNKVYEGVGWKRQVDRPRRLSYLQTNCIDIAFIGDIEEGFVPTSDNFNVAMDIIMYGVKNNMIVPNFKIIPMDKWRPSIRNEDYYNMFYPPE